MSGVNPLTDWRQPAIIPWLSKRGLSFRTLGPDTGPTPHNEEWLPVGLSPGPSQRRGDVGCHDLKGEHVDKLARDDS